MLQLSRHVRLYCFLFASVPVNELKAEPGLRTSLTPPGNDEVHLLRVGSLWYFLFKLIMV